MPGQPAHIYVLAKEVASTAIVRELVTSTNAARSAFVVFLDGLCTLHLPDGELTTYELCEHLSMDDHGQLVAYRCRHAGQWFASVGTERHKAFGWVGELAVSPDGRSVAYFAESAGSLTGPSK